MKNVSFECGFGRIEVMKESNWLATDMCVDFKWGIFMEKLTSEWFWCVFGQCLLLVGCAGPIGWSIQVSKLNREIKKNLFIYSNATLATTTTTTRTKRLSTGQIFIDELTFNRNVSIAISNRSPSSMNGHRAPPLSRVSFQFAVPMPTTSMTKTRHWQQWSVLSFYEWTEESQAIREEYRRAQQNANRKSKEMRMLAMV